MEFTSGSARREFLNYRPPFFAAVSLMCGVALSALMRYTWWAVFLVSALFMSLFIVGVVRKKRLLALVFGWGAAGLIVFYTYFLLTVAAPVTGYGLVTGRVSEVLSSSYSGRYLIKDASFNGEALNGSVQLYTDKLLNVGEVITFQGNLELIDIDPFDSIGAYYLGEGMRFTAEPDFVTVTALEDLTLVESLKKALSEMMTRYMGSDSAAVVMGLTIGERADIPSEVTDAFTGAGVSHILSVSGLHVSFMAGMVYGFMRLIKRPMKKALLPLAVILPLYCLMTGFEPGVIRASVTALIFLSALSVKARFDALNALSASAIVILLTMPWSLFDVGFQMSFAAVLGIILFYKPLFRVLRPGGFRPVHKLLRRIAASLALSVSANILLIGISFSVFGTFAVYFIPANLIAVPIASLIYMLAVPISFLSVLIPYLGYLLVPVGYLTELLILFSEIFAGLPGSTATATVSSLAAMIYSAGVVFGSGINLMKKNVRYTVSGICAALFVLMLLA